MLSKRDRREKGTNELVTNPKVYRTLPENPSGDNIFGSAVAGWSSERIPWQNLLKVVYLRSRVLSTTNKADLGMEFTLIQDSDRQMIQQAKIACTKTSEEIIIEMEKHKMGHEYVIDTRA